jgi:hypothetical protein
MLIAKVTSRSFKLLALVIAYPIDLEDEVASISCGVDKTVSRPDEVTFWVEPTATPFTKSCHVAEPEEH